MKVKWKVIEECNDDDGTPTCWAAQVNSEKYGKFIWICHTQEGYEVQYCSCTGEDFFTLKICKSLSSAKRWVTQYIY